MHRRSFKWTEKAELDMMFASNCRVSRHLVSNLKLSVVVDRESDKKHGQ